MSTWGRRGVPRTVRQRILERDRYTCQIAEFGCLVTATEVDHVINVASLGIPREDANEDHMLQAACSNCHARKTERERRAAHAASNARRAARRHLPSTPHPGDD